MIKFNDLPFNKDTAYKGIPFRSTKQGMALLAEQGTSTLLGQVLLEDEALVFQWEALSVPMYSTHREEIHQHLSQGYGVFALLSVSTLTDWNSDLFFFQETSPVGTWEVQLPIQEAKHIAEICNQTVDTLRDPSHHLQLQLTQSTKGFAYSLGYYPTAAEEKEGYERSSQPTFRLYGEKYWLLLRVIEEAQSLRVVRVEKPKDSTLPSFSLAIGNLHFSPNNAIPPDSALRLLKEREGAEYIQLWDSYAQAEGDLLLAKIRLVGEIQFVDVPARRVTKEGTFEYVGKLKDPEQWKRFAQVEETRGTLLLSTAPPTHLDHNVSWTEYSQRRRQVEQEEDLPSSRHPRFLSKSPHRASQEAPQRPAPRATQVVEQRCQFFLESWNNTLIMHQDQKSNLHFGHYPKETSPQEDKEQEGQHNPEETFPKIYITLDLGGDATRIKRRNQARNRMLDGASANPRMSKVMEGKQTSKAIPQEILDPLTLDQVMCQSFPHGATSSQREAVNLSLNTPDIALIQGPPGTGKTTVITAVIEAIHRELSQDRRKAGEILITSYQHDAVDHVQKKILTGSIPPVKFEGQEGSGEKSAVEVWCQAWKSRFLATHSQLETSLELEKLEDRYHHYQSHPTQEEGRLFLEFASSLSKTPSLQRHIKDLLASSTQEEDSDFLLSRIRSLRTTKQGFLDDGVARASDVIYALCGDSTQEKGASRQQQAKKKYPFLFQALTIEKNSLTSAFLQQCVKGKKQLLEACIHPPSTEQMNPEITEVFLRLQREWTQYDQDTSTAKETLVYKDLLHEITHQSHHALRDMMSKYALVYGATLQHSVAKPMANAKLGTSQGKSQGRTSDTSLSFNTVIVDEAARANPMDLMIAITQGKQRLILVGDHRQLPQVYDEELLETLQESSDISLGLEQSRESMFQYLMAMAKKLEAQDGISRTLTLKEQFRMHPLLGNFVNQQFYQCHSIEEGFSSPLPPAHFAQTLEPVPLLWLDVPLSQQRKSEGQVRSRNSLKREQEAQCIADTLCSYLEKEDATSYTYGVISFYNGQKEEILSCLEEKKRAFPQLAPRLDEVEVGTVDSFQGKEFDVMFLSLVRSNPPKAPRKDKEPRPNASEDPSSEEISPNLPPHDSENPKTPPSSLPMDEETLEKLGKRTYGFMTMENRLCVALSRQKRLLVVVGNSSIYGSDPKWRELATTCVPSLQALYQLSLTEGKVRQYGSPTSGS